MKIIRSVSKMQKTSQDLKISKKSIGFVPTMGALHAGHISLIKQARKENDIVIVSIFVNPTQFAPMVRLRSPLALSEVEVPNDDFRCYPRNLKTDILSCKKEGVEFIFHPDAKQIYPKGFKTHVLVEKLSDVLCGKFRPGHFKGVATIVTKLFNIVQPDIAYFGQKDAQQAIIIQQMARDLNMPVKIRVMPIIREPDEVALSSRNRYLTAKQREDATVLWEALRKAKTMIEQGAIDSAGIRHAMRRIIQRKKTAHIQYIEIVDLDELDPLKRVQGKVLIALAVMIGKTRLIDNIITKTQKKKLVGSMN